MSGTARLRRLGGLAIAGAGMAVLFTNAVSALLN